MSRILEALKRGPAKVNHCDVLFNTLYRHEADGWAIASRAYARAMSLAGVDVRLRQWVDQLAPLTPSVEAEVGHMLRPPTDWGLYVFSGTLSGAEDMRSKLDVLAEEKGKRAYYCVFERRYVEPGIAEAMNRLDGVWVQCQMNLSVLREAGVRNATLVPYPYFDDDPHLSVEPTKRATVFYNIGRFEPRKDPANLVRAFLRAFGPGEAKLVLKTSPLPYWGFYPTPERTLRTALAEREALANGWTRELADVDVRVLTRRLTPAEMVGLHAACDVYVSASRGEGLDLPPYTAKHAGRRIVTTASGGPEDFLDPEVDVVVPSRGLVPADPAYKWGEGATYVDYSVDELAAAMRHAHRKPRYGSRIWPGMHRHRAESVGAELRDWVKKVTS